MRDSFWAGAVIAALSMGCSAGSSGAAVEGAGAQGAGGNGQGGNGQGGSAASGFGGFGGSGGSGGSTGEIGTCEEAAAARSYIGCDFWPTVTANGVWSIFDFAVIVANAGAVPAEISVDRGGGIIGTGTVAPGGLGKFFLPWVPELKGPEADACGSTPAPTTSVRVPAGAYHLTSSVPVSVYQFNALEYRGQGGPQGKSWSGCPGNSPCVPPLGPSYTTGCFSFSNDASLLLPTTAMTATYRVTSHQGNPMFSNPAFMAVTGTMDGTTVNVTLSPSASVQAGGGLGASNGGGALSFALGRGEVVQVLGARGGDFSGSLVTASAPVQVITGVQCVTVPSGEPACDHIEESVFPAETLGQRYFVASPTAPNGSVVGHVVRIYGNIDGTALTYAGAAPATAPATINAGQVVDLGVVSQDFEVSGTNSFAVGSVMLGGSRLDPGTMPPNQKGDPSMSIATAVEQYRTKYVFLAPDDYDVSYVDIVMPTDAQVFVDGIAINAPITPIANGFGIARQSLGAGQQGAHSLDADKPVGIQVVGYGSYTSYQYPGGSDLLTIAPPPPK